MIALCVFTDGRRDCIERTLASARTHLHFPLFTTRFIYDDSQSASYSRFLRETYERPPWNFRICSWSYKQGFGGTIRGAWYQIRTAAEREEFIFHLEDDFTFNADVDLEALMLVLATQPNVVQLALRRQPWNDLEREAGGVIEQHPEAYVERSDTYGNAWLEHRLFFTTNPSLYRRQLVVENAWPDERHSEGVFTHALLNGNADARFAFWGKRVDKPLVHHIGTERVGTGY